MCVPIALFLDSNFAFQFPLLIPVSFSRGWMHCDPWWNMKTDCKKGWSVLYIEKLRGKKKYIYINKICFEYAKKISAKDLPWSQGTS